MAAGLENRPLTALRGLAAVWVVLHHAELGWSLPAGRTLHDVLLFGQLAVDVFFVLSGFIMARVYRDLRWHGAGRFALRRLSRIYPLHVCVMLALALSALLSERLRSGSTHPWGDFLPDLLLLNPLLQLPPAWNPPSWSAGVELCCYLLFLPLAFLLRQLPRPALPAFALIAALSVATVQAHFAGTTVGVGAVLRGLSGFTLGAALAACPPLAPRRWTPLLASAALVAATVLLDPVATALAAAALVTVLGAPAVRLRPVERALASPALVWLGQISFSIYLLHVPLLVQFGRLPPVRTMLQSPAGAWGAVAAFMLVLLPLATLTHRYIEQPARRWAARQSRPSIAAQQ